MKNLILIFCIAAFTFTSCQQPENKNNKSVEQPADEQNHIYMSEYPELLQKALEAHGGLDKWNSYVTLQYDKVSIDGSVENQLINLNNRKVLINRDSVKIGFNGKEVWVSPNLEAYGQGSARFYHNLHFYFFGIPFLLADPGINYEELGNVSIDSVDYKALKITYNEGVGDSDEDVYIAHFDPDTHQLKLLLYTVTYFGEDGSPRYNALKYDQWQDVDGLLLPKQYIGYVYENGSLGKKRYSATFNNVSLSIESPSDSTFQMPDNAEIDSLSKY